MVQIISVCGDKKFQQTKNFSKLEPSFNWPLS